MTADLGHDRYARHLWWWASGTVEGDEEYEEDATPFVVQRRDDRWLWTDVADGSLRTVGDSVRDLQASQGGLVRECSPRGFLGHDGVAMVRRLGPFTDDWLATLEVTGSTEIEIAGRTARLFRLANSDGEMSLGVDEETGIWTYFQIEDHLTITVDTLVVGDLATTPVHPAAFVLLDIVPDVSVSKHREPVLPALEPALRAVEQASGVLVEVVSQEPESQEFEFVLVDVDGQVVGRVLRRRAIWNQSPSTFGGSQSWMSGGEYEMHVDTAWTEPQAAGLIMKPFGRGEVRFD